jgi:hypothetical protein
MSATQEWIKNQYQTERGVVGENVEYTNMRLSREAMDLKERVKKLETDMAFLIKEKNEE